ncbi:MAG: type II secretion system protein GspE [Desulfuromonas sp.]|nr:type II secretion system protein GspE [Desulfuromonas sp.]
MNGIRSGTHLWRRIGEILHDDFGVPRDRIETAATTQKVNGSRLGEALVGTQALAPETLGKALAIQAGLPYLDSLAEAQPAAELLDRIPIGFAKDCRIFPLGMHGQSLLVAVADPFDPRPLNDLSTLTNTIIEPRVAAPDEILRAINRSYESQTREAQDAIEEIVELTPADLARSLEPQDLLDTADEAPIIRFVNSLITQGYRDRASDIHIEPFERTLVVRYRIDGILYEILHPPLKAHSGIVSRIKIMAHLNIAEKRLPQDGRFRVRVAGRDLDVRVSTLPTAFGERIVLRLLDKSAGVLTLAELGMNPDMLLQVERMVTKSHGIFLVTGPTGSGKTTTLYAALSKLNDREKNIITVEDPIEYQLAGVGQIQVNPKINLTFANGLRSILRQDPDIIMVGEIRDRETAEIAVQSALTGHMVFSTLHTNDAAGALTRLVEMGIEPFLTASCVVGILAQRLVRRICPHCREVAATPEGLLKELNREGLISGQAVFYQGRGCPQCMETGYRGRTGIYELLPMDETVRDLLMQNRDSTSIKQAAVEQGMETLRGAGVAMALRGEISLAEVLRVTQEES